MHRSIRRGVAAGLATITVSALVAVTGASSAVAAPSQPGGIRGIDVYQLSPSIDYSAQYDKGTRFVYVKASGGTTVDNDLLAQQWSATRGTAEKQLIHGAYHKALPNGPSKTDFVGNGTKQADYFLSQSEAQGVGEPLWVPGGWTLPPMLDLEVASGVSDDLPVAERQKLLCYSMSPSQLTTFTAAFSKEVLAKTGRIPVLYTNPDFWQNCMGNSASFSANPLFQASYTGSVGAIGRSWAGYTMWQWDNQASLGTKGVDQDVYNGTLTSLHLLADPAYGSGASTTPRLHDFNGDAKNDVMVVSSSGTPAYYRGDGKGHLLSSSAVSMGSGLSSYNAFAAVGTTNATGYAGLYARGSSGTLYYFPFTAAGKLGARVTVASGWSTMSAITSAGDFNGDGIADLLAVDKVGVLWAYLGAGDGTFSGRVQVSTGWNAKTAVVGGADFTGDGNADLLARTSAGLLVLYPHTPVNGSLHGTTLTATGWNSYKRLFTPGDITGDGKADLMAVGSSGKMYLFAGTGKAASPFGTRKAFGTATSWGTRLFVG